MPTPFDNPAPFARPAPVPAEPPAAPAGPVTPVRPAAPAAGGRLTRDTATQVLGALRPADDDERKRVFRALLRELVSPTAGGQ